jgi:hypothetical protein
MTLTTFIYVTVGRPAAASTRLSLLTARTSRNKGSRTSRS